MLVGIDAVLNAGRRAGRYRLIRGRGPAPNEARLPAMRLFALALAFLVLGGCVEYRESIVLERDESGTVVMAIGVKEALLRAAEVAESGVYDPASALDALRMLPGLQIVESRAEAHDGTRWLHLVLAFESLEAPERDQTGSSSTGRCSEPSR